jgi:hypothetical protein
VATGIKWLESEAEHLHSKWEAVITDIRSSRRGLSLSGGPGQDRSGLISIGLNVYTGKGGGEHWSILFGRCCCVPLLPKPQIRLVGVTEVSHTARSSDADFACLIGLPSR